MNSASASSGLLTGRRVSMLVWNGFVYDARVKREALTLVHAGARVQVTAILTSDSSSPFETTSDGIEVHRIPREVPRISRLVLFPRYLLRKLGNSFTRSRPQSLLGPVVRWWELDRRLVFLLEELAVNWRMFLSAGLFSPDVVHAHDVNTLVPAWMVSVRSPARLVYDAHEISADREGYEGRIWLIKIVEKWLGRTAAGVITTTHARACWFRKTYCYDAITVLQNRPMRCVVEGSELLRERFRIPQDEPIILYQGGLQWGRGLANLLDAFRGLSRCHLVFIGDGVERQALQEMAADLNGRVHFAGQIPLSELPRWTASAEIGVQTLRNTCLNHFTTDSNKLFEYVMAGLPVVASDFPEIRAVVLREQVGELVNPDDVESIRAALRKLVEDRELRARLAANARRARDHLDWSSQERGLLDLYKTVLPLTD